MKLPPPCAHQGLHALRAGAVSCVEAVQASLTRIEALQPRLNAFMHLDADRALRHARAIDGLRAAGVDLGPLMGVPVAIKDHFSVDGMPTTAGTRIDIQDLVAPQGRFVDALLRAGCVPLGKTRTTEFALGGFNFDAPPPWNPCDPSQPRMTGGSSHGSAVAMAAGLAGFTVGSDTGGSVRWPAALCGVVGYKSSPEHWPGDGVFPLSPGMDSVGVLTASAQDAAAIEAALAQRPLRPPPAIDRLTLAAPTQHFLDGLDAAVAKCYDEALRSLSRAGARIVAIELPAAAEIDEVFRSLVPSDLLAFLGRARIEPQLDRLDAAAADRLKVAFGVKADDYARMAARRQELVRIARERSRGIDAWLSPTVPVLPNPTAQYPTVEQVSAWNRLATRNTRPANLFDQCGISLPIQHLGADLPVGLQLCAGPGEDEPLLGVARAVEDLLGRPAPPALDCFAA